jgi:hypothetical protein
MILPKLIGRFKMLTSKQINEIRNTPGAKTWQRNYYEHIIRNDDDLYRIRKYIIDNPAKWHSDRENPAASTPGRGGFHTRPIKKQSMEGIK